jgi:hypothetical protein
MKRRLTGREKLADSKDLPKVVPITGKAQRFRLDEDGHAFVPRGKRLFVPLRFSPGITLPPGSERAPKYYLRSCASCSVVYTARIDSNISGEICH